MAIKLVISGCCGRMGSIIARLALPESNNPPLEIAGALEAHTNPQLGRDLGEVLGREPLGVKITSDIDHAIQKGDVLIEFTNPEATVAHLERAVKFHKPMVIGTTGLSEEDRARVQQASTRIPIVWSPNMSIGVNLMFELVQIATERLGPSYPVEMVETHHQGKKDRPSGTAKRLQEIIAAVRARWHIIDEVPCASIRKGDVAGDHTVMFSRQGYETLEITHHALSRDVFALGALKAAQFVVNQPPGLYDMSHVLRAK